MIVLEQVVSIRHENETKSMVDKTENISELKEKLRPISFYLSVNQKNLLKEFYLNLQI